MITLTDLCSCACGSLLVTREERADNISTACADAPAVSDVRPDVIAAYALAKEHRIGIGG